MPGHEPEIGDTHRGHLEERRPNPSHHAGPSHYSPRVQNFYRHASYGFPGLEKAWLAS